MKNLLGWLFVRLFFLMVALVLCIFGGFLSVCVRDFLGALQTKRE